MAEYIEREALMKNFCGYDLTKCVKYGNKDAGQQHDSYSTMMMYEIADEIMDAPAADVAQVVPGRWIKEKTRDDFDSMKCTACNGLLLVRWHTRLDFFRYCPNCGARMDLEEQNEAKESGQP